MRDIQWFQQDGATPHTANLTLEWLEAKFPDPLVSRRHDPEWVPYSPNLSPPDFYLWGYLKDRVYKDKPRIIPELKEAITAEIRAISKEECCRVMNNLVRKMQVCLQHNGSHSEHII